MTYKGSWGASIQGNGQFQELDELGKKLNLAIQCPVHFPAFGKNMFECMCGVTFPLYVVKGRSASELARLHDEGSGTS